MTDKTNKNTHTTYFRKAARNFYFIAIVSFTICLLSNQPDYFVHHSWGLILTDSISILLIFIALLLHIRKKIGLKLNCSIYVYTTLLNLAISSWYFYYQNISFTGNFLFSTFLYCINIVVAGFCIGRKHAFIAAVLYVVSFGPLIYASHDLFLYQNAFSIVFLITAFSFGVSGFLHVLEKSHKEELGLKDEIFEKDKAIAREHNKWLSLELGTKQKEIVAKTMFLLEYAENNNALIKKLENLKERIKNSEQRALNEIILQHRIDHHEKYWKEFETSFLEVHPDFYKKLNLLCPDLSPSELKLAALVHLGLSSKQIGSLSANAPESIDVARSRLRSKLNLPVEVNLKTYLLNL
jgi:hypothetical protein